MYKTPAIIVAAFVAAITISGVGHGDNRVLVIGIDGAGGSHTEAANTPHLDALAADGAVRYDWLNEAALAANTPELSIDMQATNADDRAVIQRSRTLTPHGAKIFLAAFCMTCWGPAGRDQSLS